MAEVMQWVNAPRINEIAIEEASKVSRSADFARSLLMRSSGEQIQALPGSDATRDRLLMDELDDLMLATEANEGLVRATIREHLLSEPI